MMRTMCWNCRMIGNLMTVCELRDLMEVCAPSILCLVETQLAKDRVEGLAGSLGFSSRFVVPCSGRSGGIGLY